MLRIRTLGGLTVVRDGAEHGAVAVQRRRLALLALVASSGDRGVTRDVLMAYLWPESDPASARHSLKQATFRLRRDLGSELLFGVRELRLNRDLMLADCAELDTALAEDRLDDAMALYGGPFLDGFHLPHAAEFERWVDGERDRIARRVQRALEANAMRAAAGGDATTAVRRWQQLVSLDPLSSRHVLGLMSALASVGDAPGAVRVARAHEALVRAELEAAPDPAVVGLAERLRRLVPGAREAAAGPGGGVDPERIAASPGGLGQMQDVEGGTVSPRARAGVAPSNDDRQSAASDAPSRVPRRRRQVTGIVVGIVAMAAIASGVLLVTALSRRDARVTKPARSVPPSGSVVAVFPFTVFGAGADSSFFRQGVAELLSRDLDGAGNLRSADFRAIDAYDARHHLDTSQPDSARTLAGRFGAGSFVLGEAVRSGATLRLAASLYASGDSVSPEASAQVEGDSLRLLDLIDRLAAALLGKSGWHRSDGLDRLAARTTTSLVALKAYLRGEALFRDARYTESVDAFQQAVAADPNFALAYYRLAEAADWASDWQLSVRSAERAYQLRNRVTAHTGLLLDGFRSWRVGNIARAERDYRVLLRWNPASIEARYQLGEVLFHNNPARGRSVLEARAPFEQVLAVDPDDRYALSHLLRLYELAGDTAIVDTIARRFASLEPPGDARLAVEMERAFTLRDSATEARVLARMATASDQMLLDSFYRVAVYAGNLDAAEQIALLLTRPQRAKASREYGLVDLTSVYLAEGKWQAARGPLRSVDVTNPVPGLYAHAFLAAQPMAQLPRAELEWLRSAVEREAATVPPAAPADDVTGVIFDPVTRVYVHGLLSVRLGDTTAALHDAEEVWRIARRDGRDARGRRYRIGDVDALDEDARSVAASLRGLVAAVGGRHAQAVALLEQSRPRLWLEFLASFAGDRSIERFTLAQELEAVGRHDDALRWYSTVAQRYGYELPLRAPAELREGEIDERLGRRADAVRHYETFLALWRNADPEARPSLEGAAERVAALRAVASAR